MTQLPANYDPHEWAALYAAGALTPQEEQEFEAILRSGEAGTVEAWREIEPTIGLLAAGAAPVTPPPSIREKLLKRIDAAQKTGKKSAKPYAEVTNPAEVFVKLATEDDWRNIGAPGVFAKSLYVDQKRKVQTLLLRLEPGAAIPEHPHHDAEECYVIEGEVESFGMKFKAGDYVRAEAGTLHGITRSATGCLLLLTTGIGDDIEAA